MKVVIPLQTVLVAILLLGVSVFLAIVYKDNNGKGSHITSREGFVDLKDLTYSFKHVLPAHSRLDRMEIHSVVMEILQNGQCNGRTVCSLSSNSDTMPSCVNLLRKDLAAKATGFAHRLFSIIMKMGIFADVPLDFAQWMEKARSRIGRPAKLCKVYELESGGT
jgi:hypothetical protein